MGNLKYMFLIRYLIMAKSILPAKLLFNWGEKHTGVLMESDNVIRKLAAIKGECPGNSSETDRRLTAEVFIPGKRATPASVAKYLYSIHVPAHPAHWP